MIREDVRDFQAYALAPDDAPPPLAKLDFNESPYDVPAELKDRVLDRLRGRRWSVYPEFGAPRLKAAISRAIGRSPDEIVVGNGSGEVILAAVSVFAGVGGTLVLAPPTFSLYSQMAVIAGARRIPIPRLTRDFLVDEEAFLAFPWREERGVPLVCSPNNPTGGVESRDFVRRLAGRADVVLADQAYVDFAEAEDDLLPLLAEVPNLVVFRTLSKAFSAAGFRIGYAVTRPALAREIEKAVLPFSVDLAAEELALAVLEEPETARRTVATIRDERIRVAAFLDALGVGVAPSRSNFLFVRPPGDARVVRRALLARGVLVRDMTSAAEGYLRVSIGTREENDLFLGSLESILKESACSASPR